jgi:hypothetical protein
LALAVPKAVPIAASSTAELAGSGLSQSVVAARFHPAEIALHL